MNDHAFVPGPKRINVRKKKQRIIRPTREVGTINDRPDLESMSFVQQLVAMGLSGKKTAISTQIFRDSVGQLARRHRDATMGISGKYLIHALDAGSIEDCAIEVFGVDPAQTTVAIDPELTMVALDEAFEQLAQAAKKGAKIIFVSSRPAATLPLMIELAETARNAGAEILDSFGNTSALVADGRKGRRFTWVNSVGVLGDGGSLLATDDAGAADDLFFHLSRPDLVVADHVFAGMALTSGYHTLAFTGLESLAVAVASTNEKSCIAIPIALDRPSTHYSIIANYAKSFF